MTDSAITLAIALGLLYVGACIQAWWKNRNNPRKYREPDKEDPWMP